MLTLVDYATGPRAGSAGWATALLTSDLEWFWPSRRGLAFDEFCR